MSFQSASVLVKDDCKGRASFRAGILRKDGHPLAQLNKQQNSHLKHGEMLLI